MSASQPEAAIFTTDKPERAAKKVMGAFTGGRETVKRQKELGGRPEICNVYALHQVFAPERAPWVYEQCTTAGIGCVDCKLQLAESVNDHFTEFRAKHAELRAKPDYVRGVLREGAQRAGAIARETMVEVRDRIGLMAT